MIEIFEEPQWQMTPGERAAMEGVLSQLKPNLALEVGTAEWTRVLHERALPYW